MDFDEFKRQLLPLFVNQHYFDGDNQALKKYYDDFQLMSDLPTFGTVKEFASFYFQDWTKETHSAWLKTHKELQDAKKQGSKPKPEIKKKIKPFSTKTQNIKTQEDKVMREFWDDHADYRGWCRCMETRQWLRGYSPYYVHHIYTKGAHCLSRLDKENLVILGYDAHNQAHNLESEMKLHQHFKDVREKMKIKYSKNQSQAR